MTDRSSDEERRFSFDERSRFQPQTDDTSTARDVGKIRERMSTTEAKLEYIEQSQDRLVDGQEEIKETLSKIDSTNLDTQTFDRHFRPQIEQNTQHRNIAKAVAAILSTLVSASVLATMVGAL